MTYRAPQGRPISSPPDYDSSYPTSPPPLMKEIMNRPELVEKMREAVKRSHANARRRTEAEAARRNRTETGGVWVAAHQFAKMHGHRHQWASRHAREMGYRIERIAHKYSIFLLPEATPPLDVAGWFSWEELVAKTGFERWWVETCVRGMKWPRRLREPHIPGNPARKAEFYGDPKTIPSKEEQHPRFDRPTPKRDVTIIRNVPLTRIAAPTLLPPSLWMRILKLIGLR